MVKFLAIGSFDGIHKAHQELIKKSDAVAVIEHSRATITPGYTRAEYIKKPTYFYLLDKIKNDTPQEFITRLKKDFPNLEGVVVGYDFAFGKNRLGTIDTLKKNLPKSVVVPEIKVDGISVHSQVIREAIKNSNIKLANRLLGRNYKITGYQIRGLGIGSKELVPTINLKTLQYTLPQGVFAINTYIDNKKYKAICFIGNRKSIDNSFSVEFHILDNFGNKEIKSKITIEFVEFIRENRKFDTLTELKEQIFKDIKRCKVLLN